MIREAQEHVQQLTQLVQQPYSDDLATVVDMVVAEAGQAVSEMEQLGETLITQERFDLVEQMSRAASEFVDAQARVEAWKRGGGGGPPPVGAAEDEDARMARELQAQFDEAERGLGQRGPPAPEGAAAFPPAGGFEAVPEVPSRSVSGAGGLEPGTPSRKQKSKKSKRGEEAFGSAAFGGPGGFGTDAFGADAFGAGWAPAPATGGGATSSAWPGASGDGGFGSSGWGDGMGDGGAADFGAADFGAFGDGGAAGFGEGGAFPASGGGWGEAAGPGGFGEGGAFPAGGGGGWDEAGGAGGWDAAVTESGWATDLPPPMPSAGMPPEAAFDTRFDMEMEARPGQFEDGAMFDLHAEEPPALPEFDEDDEGSDPVQDYVIQDYPAAAGGGGSPRAGGGSPRAGASAQRAVMHFRCPYADVAGERDHFAASFVDGISKAVGIPPHRIRIRALRPG